MLNVTYVYGSCSPDASRTKSSFLIPGHTRIMTQVLNNQTKIKVTYEDIYLKLLLLYRETPKNDLLVDKNNSYQKALTQNLIRLIKDEYVLVTAHSSIDLIFIIECLNLGKKVVVGGPLTKIYNIKKLKDGIESNGGTNIENLLVFRPYINKDVNLYNIIKKWKDIDLDIKYDISKIFYSDEDICLDTVKYCRENTDIKYHGVSQQLGNTCSWNKCTFCSYGLNNYPIKFVNKDNVNDIAMYNISLLKKAKLNRIYIGDPEFFFSKVNRTYLDILKKHNVKVGIFASIKNINDDTFFNYIFDEYKDIFFKVSIGLECMNDNMLKLINKDQNVESIFKAANRIIKANKKIKNPVAVSWLSMFNIVTKNKDDIIENYENFFKLKKSFNDNKLPHIFDFSELIITMFNYKKYSDTPYIKLTGKITDYFVTHDRIDENGNTLPSDIDIIGYDNFKKLRSKQPLRFTGKYIYDK